MKNLFLVDGASGTGKSDFLRWVFSYNTNNVGYVKKGTTRPLHTFERSDPLDLEILSEDEFLARNYDYTYTYRGFLYGFKRSHLVASIMARENVFLIIRDVGLIKQLCSQFSFINIVPVFLYTDRSELEKRLRAANVSEEEISDRRNRAEECLRDYHLHPHQYREVIINNSSLDTFYGIINKLLDKYSGAPNIDPCLIPVMMSYSTKNKMLRRYYEAILAAIKEVDQSFRCPRINDSPGSPAIISEFRSLIASSRCVIVDLAENRQNVYYELGYIHALGKSCIITAPKLSRAHFYAGEYKILRYDSPRELRKMLQEQIKRLLVATFPLDVTSP